MCLFLGVGAEARPVCGALRGSWGYLRGRGGIGVHSGAGSLVHAPRLGPVPAAEQPGKPETQCRKGCCLGPARPCDPLYSCHNLGTFGAAPNGAPGRPAPPGGTPALPAPDPRASVRAAIAAALGLVPLVVVVPGSVPGERGSGLSARASARVRGLAAQRRVFCPWPAPLHSPSPPRLACLAPFKPRSRSLCCRARCSGPSREMSNT